MSSKMLSWSRAVQDPVPTATFVWSGASSASVFAAAESPPSLPVAKKGPS